MELLIRAVVIYLAMFFFMRIAGNRQFSEMTAFDAVLIVMIAEVTGQALVGEEYSVMGAVIVIATLVAVDVGVSLLKNRVKGLVPVFDGVPILLISEGRIIERNMKKERVELEDLVGAARQHHGLEALEQIRYAVLEPSGDIAIVPKEKK